MQPTMPRAHTGKKPTVCRPLVALCAGRALPVFREGGRSRRSARIPAHRRCNEGRAFPPMPPFPESYRGPVRPAGAGSAASFRLWSEGQCTHDLPSLGAPFGACDAAPRGMPFPSRHCPASRTVHITLRRPGCAGSEPARVRACTRVMCARAGIGPRSRQKAREVSEASRGP